MDDIGGEDSDWCNVEAKAVTWDRDKHKWTLTDRTIPVICDSFRPMPFQKGTRLLVHYHEQSGKYIPEGPMNAQVVRTYNFNDTYPEYEENDPANTFPIKFGSYNFNPVAGTQSVGYSAFAGDAPDGYVHNLTNCPEKSYIPEDTDIPVVGLWVEGTGGTKDAELRWFTWVHACIYDSSSDSSQSSSSESSTTASSVSDSSVSDSSISSSNQTSGQSSTSPSSVSPSSNSSSLGQSLSFTTDLSVSFVSSVSRSFTSEEMTEPDCFVYTDGSSSKRDGCCILTLKKYEVLNGLVICDDSGAAGEDEFEFCDCGDDSTGETTVQCDIDWECCPGECVPECWEMPLHGLGCLAGCAEDCYENAQMCWTGGGN
jgi:hypothetical protein